MTLPHSALGGADYLYGVPNGAGNPEGAPDSAGNTKGAPSRAGNRAGNPEGANPTNDVGNKQQPLRLTCRQVSDTLAFGRCLGSLLKGGDVVVLSGSLGAGKTQLAKGVARALGVAAEVTSPTFNYVLEYPLLHAAPAAVLRHFDLYRLNAASELDDLDYFGLIEEPDAISVVEWGDKFAKALPQDYLLVRLSRGEEVPELRELELTAHGVRSAKLLAGLAPGGSAQNESPLLVGPAHLLTCPPPEGSAHLLTCPPPEGSAHLLTCPPPEGSAGLAQCRAPGDLAQNERLTTDSFAQKGTRD